MVYRQIDASGLFVADVLELPEGLTEAETALYLDVEPAQGFYLPKWDGEKWVEGGIAPEPVEPAPTIEQRVATVESDVATVAEVMDALFGGVV